MDIVSAEDGTRALLSKWSVTKSHPQSCFHKVYLCSTTTFLFVNFEAILVDMYKFNNVGDYS